VQQGGVYHAQPLLPGDPFLGKGIGRGMHNGLQGGHLAGLAKDPFPQGAAIHFTLGKHSCTKALYYRVPFCLQGFMTEYIHIQYGDAPFFQ
jgi:hypothetical protein